MQQSPLLFSMLLSWYTFGMIEGTSIKKLKETGPSELIIRRKFSETFSRRWYRGKYHPEAQYIVKAFEKATTTLQSVTLVSSLYQDILRDLPPDSDDLKICHAMWIGYCAIAEQWFKK